MASGGRQPQKNMERVLRMAIENTSQSGEEEPQAQPRNLSSEDQEFLRAAMGSMMEDPVKKMEAVLRLVVSLKDDDEEKEEALETLKEWVEDIDLAKDFHKIGGCSVLEKTVQSEESEIRWRSLDIMASLAQNNPYCQEKALELGWLPVLLEKLDKDTNDQVRVKALYAISCLVRESDEAQEELVKNDGFSVLLRAMQTDVEKLRIKGSFLITSLMISTPKFKDTLCDMGMVEQLVALLQTPHQSSHEHLMSALLSLVSDHARALEESRRPELQLKQLLQQRTRSLQGKEEFLEEYEHCQNLLKLLSARSPTGRNNVDR